MQKGADMKKTIKIADGNKVTHGDEVIIMRGNAQLWKLLGWDIEHDKLADDCAKAITTRLYCFGFADLTPWCGDGETLTIEVIPVGGWDAEVAKGAEIFEGDEEE